MDTPRPSLLDLHPVEALLVLLWLSAAALLRLVANPPRLIRRRLLVAGCDVTADGLDIYVAAASRGRSVFEPLRVTTQQIHRDMPEAFAAMDHEIARIKTSIRQPQVSAAPAHGIAPGVTVAELRALARQQGLITAAGRPIHKARRADLLAALDA